MMARSRLGATIAVVAMVAVACGGEDAAPAEFETESATVTTTGEQVVVRPGRANWPTGYFQAAVYSALLEELGYTVDDPAANEYPPAEAYIAMAEGVFDFWANGWYTQHYTWHEQQLADGTLAGEHLIVLGDQVPAGALEGLVVTKSIADEHEIISLAQINDDPALAAVFDTDGNGRGEIHGCPEDWTCDDIIDEILEFNGWSNLEQVRAGYPGLVAESIRRVAAGEPAIQYTWSPSGYLTELVPGETVQWVSLGDRAHVLDGTTVGGFDFADADAAVLGEACTDDPCWLGWEPADIQVTANRAFAEANPSAVALFEVVHLNVPDIASQNVRYDAGENREADIKRHATEWVAANRSMVDEWLDEVRRSSGG